MGWFRVLIETWWWVLLGALVGLVVGWLLGRLLKPSDVLAHPHFRALKGEYDDQRVELRAATTRVAELERAASLLAADKAALAAKLDACEGARLEVAAAAVTTPAETEAAAPAFDAADDGGPVADDAGSDAEPVSLGFAAVTTPAETEAASPPFDAAAAAAAYGAKVVLDDLKIVEGIGPKIEELLHAAGIRTWRELAAAPADAVRDVLRGGGDRFRMHDPATWAEQARLADQGEFAELKALQDRLTAGRS
jgi:predicted flap endonuclease-1-like 5' DNA nuclease